MIKNPYNPRGPADPRYYANHEELLSAFRENVNAVTKSGGVTKPVNLAILGQWGMGKSSTLIRFRDILQSEFPDAHILSSVISLKPAHCEDPDTFSATILESLFTTYRTTIPLPVKVLDFIRDELFRLDQWKLTKISLQSPEFERKESLVTAINFKDTLLRFWHTLKENGTDLAVIMIDDIHYVLTKNKGEIFYNLRTDIQTLGTEGALFMVIIATPDSLYPEIRNVAEPFTRLFVRYELEPFDIRGIGEQIQKPLDVEKIPLAFSPKVVREIHEITRGHPYFVSLALWELLRKVPEGTTAVKDFRTWCPDITGIFASDKFDDDLASVTEAEKEVLFSIADLKKTVFNPREIAGRSVPMLLERLTMKGLVVRVGRGKYRLYTQLFGEYLEKKRT
jgi:hypothetical protein